MSAISLNNVWKSYDKRNWAIKEINFEIKKGEVVGLLGHNGAGKTTIMKCIMNLIFPQKGTIKIFGMESSKKIVREYIGYLPENPYLPGYYKVKEIFYLGIMLKKLNKDKMEGELKEYIKYFELENYENKEVSSLSKGNLQKVAIIFSLLGNPDIFLWDEPSQSLDPVMRKKLKELIIKKKGEGKTFLISSHILTEIEKVCDRIILIKNGNILYDLSIEEIIKNWKNLEEFYISVY
jgi:ABC-2 type transport system ATP-binding protein